MMRTVKGRLRYSYFSLLLVGLVVALQYEPVLSLVVGADRITVEELPGDDPTITYLDLREAADFEKVRIPGSRRIDLVDLNSWLANHPLDPQHLLILVCYHGPLTALAAPTTALHGYDRAPLLVGGIEAWQAAGRPTKSGPVGPEIDISAVMRAQREASDDKSEARGLQAVVLTPFQQNVSAISGGLIKPIYMVLTIMLMRRLWGATSTSLRLLWHGLAWFMAGEIFCVLNFYLHGYGPLHTIDLAHGLGMVAMSALIPWGLYRLLDDRVLHFGDPERRCTMQPLCGHCWKKDEVSCGPHQIMLFGALACLVLATIPLTGPLRPTMVLAVVNGWPTEYGVPVVNHLVEQRIFPLMAIAFFIGTFGVLRRGGPSSIRRAEPYFFIGFGLLAYPLLRHFLILTYRGAPYWADFWEETTELLLIVGLFVLVRVLGKQLGLISDPAPAP